MPNKRTKTKISLLIIEKEKMKSENSWFLKIQFSLLFLGNTIVQNYHHSSQLPLPPMTTTIIAALNTATTITNHDHLCYHPLPLPCSLHHQGITTKIIAKTI
jgi:hypothetical protein